MEKRLALRSWGSGCGEVKAEPFPNFEFASLLRKSNFEF